MILSSASSLLEAIMTYWSEGCTYSGSNYDNGTYKYNDQFIREDIRRIQLEIDSINKNFKHMQEQLLTIAEILRNDKKDIK